MTLFSSARFLSVPMGYFCFGWILESELSKWTPSFMAGFLLVGVFLYIWLDYHNTRHAQHTENKV